MADPRWVYNVKLQGGTPHNTASLKFILQYDDVLTPMTLAQAEAAASQIGGALANITDAIMTKQSLTYTMDASTIMPPVAVDCMDEAVVMCYLNDSNSLPEYYSLRIPAPKAALFMADGETVDVVEPLLIQYVQQLAQHAYVSDYEQIDTNTGSDGMARGHRRSRAKSYA